MKFSIGRIKVKKFLNDNEVFFTTIASVLLSIMAIIISYYTYKIDRRQTDIEYFEKTPDFYISAQVELNPLSNEYDNEQLAIYKYEGKAKNVDTDVKVFLDIKYNDSLEIYKHLRILLNGYYSANFLTGSYAGHILTIKGYNNNLMYVSLIDSIENRLKQKGSKFVSMRKNVVVKIEFINFLNEYVTEYYDASFGDGKLLNLDNNLVSDFINQEKNFAKKNFTLGDTDNSEKLDELISIIFKESVTK